MIPSWFSGIILTVDDANFVINHSGDLQNYVLKNGLLASCWPRMNDLLLHLVVPDT